LNCYLWRWCDILYDMDIYLFHIILYMGYFIWGVIPISTWSSLKAMSSIRGREEKNGRYSLYKWGWKHYVWHGL
jgi:hypothetical protein